MIRGKVLVTGATGDTGRATVNELLARGHKVRALAHGQDKAARKSFGEQGASRSSMATSSTSARCVPRLNGVDAPRLLCLPDPSRHPAGDGVLRSGPRRRAGVDGVVNMSQKSHARRTRKSHAATDHWLYLEPRLRLVGADGRPHQAGPTSAEWLLYVAAMICEGKLHLPFGTGRHAPIAAEDQGRVIAGILEDPEPHRGKVYPLFGPVEYSYAEIAQVLSRVLGREIEYKQVSFEDFRKFRKGEGPKPTAQRAAADDDRERAAKLAAGNDFLFQHLREVVIDHQNGVFEGTNDLVEKLGGHPPLTLEAFIEKHRSAFE